VRWSDVLSALTGVDVLSPSRFVLGPALMRRLHWLEGGGELRLPRFSMTDLESKRPTLRMSACSS